MRWVVEGSGRLAEAHRRGRFASAHGLVLGALCALITTGCSQDADRVLPISVSPERGSGLRETVRIAVTYSSGESVSLGLVENAFSGFRASLTGGEPCWGTQGPVIEGTPSSVLEVYKGASGCSVTFTELRFSEGDELRLQSATGLSAGGGGGVLFQSADKARHLTARLPQSLATNTHSTLRILGEGSLVDLNAVGILKSCVSPWGVEIPNGGSIVAFRDAVVAPGASCEQETRLCSNGALSGGFTQKNCNRRCELNQSLSFDLINASGLNPNSGYNFSDTVVRFSLPTHAINGKIYLISLYQDDTAAYLKLNSNQKIVEMKHGSNGASEWIFNRASHPVAANYFDTTSTPPWIASIGGVQNAAKIVQQGLPLSAGVNAVSGNVYDTYGGHRVLTAKFAIEYEVPSQSSCSP